MKRPVKRTKRNPSDLERALAGDKNLEGANLEGAKLQGANLAGADLRRANLSKASLRKANLEGANLSKANLEAANLTDAKLEGANLQTAYLRYANLDNADLNFANLQGASLYKANLGGANLERANLNFANLTDAKLDYADLNFANLKGANLRNANLSKAKLYSADLTDADLAGADLTGADLTGADLTGANLTGVNLTDAKLPAPEAQVLPVVTPTSDAFYRWFGESKIINADGAPRVLYHGTNKAGFTAFSLEKIDKWHPGFFFADTPELAKTYTSSRQFDPFAVDKSKGIYRVYVKMERPFVYDCEGALWREIKFEGKKVKTDDIGHWAKTNGYDGAILLNVIDEGMYGRAGLGPQTVYIVFNPGNIKSATYNVGTWDPNDPDIRHNPLSRLRPRKRATTKANPLVGWDYVGEPFDPKTIDRATRPMFSPSAPQVYAEKLKTTKLPIHVVIGGFEEQRHVDDLIRQGRTVLWLQQTLGTLFRFMGQDAAEIMSRKRGERGRVSPMTPFTLLHRMGDALRRTQYHQLPYGGKERDDEDIGRMFDLLHYTKPNIDFRRLYSSGVHTLAGREGWFTSWREAISDLWAKYLLTGKIDYDPEASPLDTGATKGGRSRGPEWSKEELEARRSYSEKLHHYFPKWLKASKGAVFVISE